MGIETGARQAADAILAAGEDRRAGHAGVIARFVATDVVDAVTSLALAIGHTGATLLDGAWLAVEGGSCVS
jgi:hypothetical protein